jgi:hypothetical protein
MTDLAQLQAPILVFGGPYSNLRALEALRERAGELGIPPSRSICTGDVVAYCVEPEETSTAVRAWGCHVVAGNCEEQLAAGAADCACGFDEGKRVRPPRQGLVSVRQRADLARQPGLDGRSAIDAQVPHWWTCLPRHPRRGAAGQSLRVRLAARGAGRGAGLR